MAIVTVLTAIFILGISTVIFTGPVHPTAKPGDSEQYIVRAHVYSGRENPTWTIDVSNNSTNVQTIIKALHILGHSLSHGAQELPSMNGYAGLEIDHVINNMSLHIWYIPRCSKPRLEYSIVKYTAGTNISDDALGLINATIKKCIDDAKAATRTTAAKP